MPANSSPPTSDDFQRCLDAIPDIGRDNGLPSIVVESKILHRMAGGYSRPHNRMPMCCGAMRKTMKPDDEILPNRLKKDGATLRIRYLLS